MAELDTIYIILGGQAVAMLVTTAVYYALRLRIEMKKEQSARASFESMVEYHSKRLDIEEEKLEIARGNAPSPEGVLVREHSRKPRDIPYSELESIHEDMVRRFPSLGNADNSVDPTATEGTGEPDTIPREVEFAIDAAIKRNEAEAPPKLEPVEPTASHANLTMMSDEEFMARIKKIREMWQ